MAKTGVEVHAICVMSNHIDIIVTDVEGRLPEVMRERNLPIASALQRAAGPDAWTGTKRSEFFTLPTYQVQVLPTLLLATKKHPTSGQADILHRLGRNQNLCINRNHITLKRKKLELNVTDLLSVARILNEKHKTENNIVAAIDRDSAKVGRYRA